jgi:DNA-binding CsgD family transcriptional regulator
MAPHKDWSHLTKEYLESLYQELGNWKRVAVRLGIGRSVLIRVRERLGMELWQYPAPENRNPPPSRLDPRREEILAMAAEGLNCGEIARQIDDDPETVRDFLARNGIARQRPGARHGEKNQNWRGGRLIDQDGYVLVKAKDHPNADRHGYVRLHRLVMEEKLGRLLDPQEVVHHVDGDRQNNEPENLVLFDNNGLHLQHEWQDPAWREHQSAIRRGVPSRRRIREESGTYALWS